MLPPIESGDALLIAQTFTALASAVYYLAAAVTAVACTLLALLVVDVRAAREERK